MKKIGIITINDYNNYGNRLQCYAVQETLKKLNCVPENIFNTKINKKQYDTVKLKNKIKRILHYKYDKTREERRKLFNNFNKNIKYSKYSIYNSKSNKEINEKYDSFVVGSDQVWNPQFAAFDVDFLTFADKSKKNSFSASIGISELPDNEKNRFHDMLIEFNNISVREDKAKEIVCNLTKKNDVEVLVDPTMLLDAEEWGIVERKPKILKSKKYILNYFFGDISDNWKYEIERVAKENNCDIINILDSSSKYYATGPSEFLYLVKNSFLVCTNSFHSTVFSIIYDRPVVVFKRADEYASMNSRLDTLLSKFDMENREFNGKITNDLLKCDYSNAKKILEKEKEKSKKFLCKALDINE